MTNVHTTLPLVFTEEKITEEAFAILDEPQFISKLLPSLGEQLKFIAHVRELKEKTKSQQKLIEEQVSIDFKTLYPDAKNIEEVLPSLRPKLFELLRGKKSRDELIPQIKLLEVDNSEDRQNLGALLAIVNLLNVTNYRTKFGNDVFYQPIVDELNFLSETGIFLDTKCYTGQVYFALALTLSDNLGHAQTLSLIFLDDLASTVPHNYYVSLDGNGLITLRQSL
ncbi:hypothetical protein M8J76_003379 [Diaphorina citri]|nr:hypothetical protein M8J76_003379 [Diaphorina citri]